jgi:hypothetical protein
MLTKIVLNKTQQKAQKSFDYQCKRASKCRHDKYMESCHSCPEEPTCDIQLKIKTAKIAKQI